MRPTGLAGGIVAFKVHKALYDSKVLARLLDLKSALRSHKSEADFKSAALSLSPEFAYFAKKGKKMNGTTIMSALGLLALLAAGPVLAADEDGRTLAAKSGETIDVRPVYGASHCKSILTAPPEVELLQGPPEVKLSVREDMVTPRNCREKIKGGYVVATVGQIKQPIDGKLTFRVKYKTKDETRQVGYNYSVTLVP